jgi:hypothetical protein
MDGLRTGRGKQVCGLAAVFAVFPFGSAVRACGAYHVDFSRCTHVAFNYFLK